MKKKLWETGKTKLHPVIEAFETGDDLVLDQKLLKYDILGSLAHAKMLGKIGVLEGIEGQRLKEGLEQILKLDQAGKFILKPGDEDMHTKIENYLTQKYGEVGKKIHTGRSRNDQVLTAIRLFSKAAMLDVWEAGIRLGAAFADFAKKNEFVPMPGYTHMQKAMPSSLGMWAEGFAELLLDDLGVLKTAYELNNQSPLGSGAGYGVPLNLDREYTARLLGFRKVQSNSLSVQNSRGKIEASIVSAMISLLQTINKFASDVMLFTTSEFNYFTVSDAIASGSSIMPQKKNVDIAELLRSKVHVVLGNYTGLVSMSSNLPSGYNRDLQDSKKPLFDSLKITKESLVVSKLLLENIIPNIIALEKALTLEIFAAHNAFSLVKKGMPFREAYKQVKNGKFQVNLQNHQEMLNQSTHVGGTGNLGLQNMFKTIKTEEKMFQKEKKKWIEILNQVGDDNKNERG